MTEDRDKWRKYVHGVAKHRIEDRLRGRLMNGTLAAVRKTPAIARSGCFRSTAKRYKFPVSLAGNLLMRSEKKFTEAKIQRASSITKASFVTVQWERSLILCLSVTHLCNDLAMWRKRVSRLPRLTTASAFVDRSGR